MLWSCSMQPVLSPELPPGQTVSLTGILRPNALEKAHPSPTDQRCTLACCSLSEFIGLQNPFITKHLVILHRTNTLGHASGIWACGERGKEALSEHAVVIVDGFTFHPRDRTLTYSFLQQALAGSSLWARCCPRCWDTELVPQKESLCPREASGLIRQIGSHEYVIQL